MVIASPINLAWGLKGLTQELKLIALAFVVVIVVLKIAYYKEGFFEIIKIAAALFWLFVLPGYGLLLYWKDKLGFLERIAIGTVVAMAISGIAGYYLGLIGLKLQNQTALLPALLIAASLALYLKSSTTKDQQLR